MTEQEMDIGQLARYLHLDLAKIEKLLKKQSLPARRVGGEWRFQLSEINRWLEDRIGVADLEELEKMEESFNRQAGSSPTGETMISQMLRVEHIIKPLHAKTKGSVIRGICSQAMQLGLLWDEAKMAQLIQEREEMHSTALDNGLALLHPRRPQPSIIGDPFLLLAVTSQGLPFGGPRGQLTDVFVLLASREDSGHLQALARFSRMLQDPAALVAIRQLDSPLEIWQALREIEDRLS